MSSFDDFPQGTFDPVMPSDASSHAPDTRPVPATKLLWPEEETSFASGQSSYRHPAIQSTDLRQALTGTFVKETTTSMRVPIVIKGSMKKRAPVSHHRSAKRRLVATILGTFLLLITTGGTLLAVSPLGKDLGMGFNLLPIQPGGGLAQNANSNLGNLVLQATATAVSHQQTDGFDPNAHNTVTVSNGAGSLAWPVGQCTYWANSRYHALTGFWVSWQGNAGQWATGASMAGWKVSTQPHVPSIIVLLPGVQGASSAYGHVAVVEKQLSSTTVQTSTMNWYADGGGFDIVSTFDFTVASGVYFIWHP